MLPVNFKLIQQQNNAAVCGVYVCPMRLITWRVEPGRKCTPLGMYRMRSALILINFFIDIADTIAS
jgi:hypothetical protein